MQRLLSCLALAQRETLLHARDSANEIAENLAESRKFVKMIQRRMAQNKVRARALHRCRHTSGCPRIARRSQQPRNATHHTHSHTCTRKQSIAEQAKCCRL